jgi:hypothetical protein
MVQRGVCLKWLIFPNFDRRISIVFMPFDAQLNSVQLVLKVYKLISTFLLHENPFKEKIYAVCSEHLRVSLVQS